MSRGPTENCSQEINFLLTKTSTRANINPSALEPGGCNSGHMIREVPT